MKRMTFVPPTDFYDERVRSTDEQICELIRKRKEISDNNPGFPTLNYIKEWAKKFDLYEDLLKSIFGSLSREENFKAIDEPDEFRKNLPVLKYVEKENKIFSVMYIRQYNNVSVINFNIDGEVIKDSAIESSHHKNYRLFIDDYDCRMNGGGGSSDHYSYSFIVSPPLPDDISGLKLLFKEYSFLGNKPTGLEIEIGIG